METTLGIEFPQSASAPPPAAAPQQAQPGFGELLASLNPLQYVPVVGNIFRALTGEAPPEPVLIAGQVAFSALTGGPLGVAIYAAITVAEKLTGFDPDRIAHTVLADIGVLDGATPATAAAAYARTEQAGAIGHG
jgi:hypothetical protein